MEPLRLVVRYLDGRMVKGRTLNFNPAAPSFQVTWANDDPNAEPMTVALSEVKAIFFVHDFAGRPKYEERKHFLPNDPNLGRRIRVRFRDGEVMIGSAPGWTLTGPGFFFFPADPRSNNAKAWIVSASVLEIAPLTAGQGARSAQTTR